MIDLKALILLVILGFLAALLRYFASGYKRPHLLFSNLKGLKAKKGVNISRYLLFSAAIFFAIALLDPHYFVEKENRAVAPTTQKSVPTEGIAMYLVLDQSGSMQEEVTLTAPTGKRQQISKMELLKIVTRFFVAGNENLGLKGRPSDLIGIVKFARTTEVQAPLTLDHAAIIDELDRLNFTADPADDGTAIGYAIYKTANLIKATRDFAQDLGESYDIKSSVMIVVTDGLQAPNPLDQKSEYRNIALLEAATFAKDNGIRIYFINVDPKIATEENREQRLTMKKVAEMTGGRFYLMSGTQGLDQIYADIDRLEKSAIPVQTQMISPKSDMPMQYDRNSLYPYLITMGMIALFLSVIMETVWMRRVP